MSCTYYTWRDDYYCVKQQKSVPDDIYYKYCRNYDYRDCPIFKDEGGSTGCYLTSACVEEMGLPDDCYELTTLRGFRDTYMKSTLEGRAEVEEYYRIAPLIVSAIDRDPDKDSILRGIYDNLIIPCIKLIEEEEYEKAHALYRDTTVSLKKSMSLSWV